MDRNIARLNHLKNQEEADLRNDKNGKERRKVTEKGFTSSSSSNGLGSLLNRLIVPEFFQILNLTNRTQNF